MAPLARRLKNLGDESAFKVNDDIRRCEERGLEVIRLNLGEPDFDSAENINRAAIEELRAGNAHYTDPQGVLPLRESIARDVEEKRGVALSPERIVVTSGGKPPIGYALLTYLDPGDEVVYPSPGFPIYESWIHFVQAVPAPVFLKEEKNFRFEAADLEPLVTPRTKLVILNSPSNPTGGVLTRADLDAMAELLLKKAHPDFRVLSDEVYEEIIFEGRKHQSILSSPGMAGRTILLNSFSKTFAMTGWRLGYAALPTVEEARVFRQWNINTYSCTPPFIQMAGRAALENEENKAIVAAMRREFEQRRNAVVAALNRIQGLACATPAGAFYAFPNISGVCQNLGVSKAYDELPPEIKAKTSPATLFQLFALYRHGVATLDRRSFGLIGSEGQPYLRISTASNLDRLREGLKRIEAAARDAAGFEEFVAQGGPFL